MVLLQPLAFGIEYFRVDKQALHIKCFILLLLSFTLFVHHQASVGFQFTVCEG